MPSFYYKYPLLFIKHRCNYEIQYFDTNVELYYNKLMIKKHKMIRTQKHFEASQKFLYGVINTIVPYLSGLFQYVAFLLVLEIFL